MHRIFNLNYYVPGGLVLVTKHGFAWDKEMFAKGEKPEALIDYPVHAIDYETIDLFNWQDQAKNMISQLELTRRVSAQSETIAIRVCKRTIACLVQQTQCIIALSVYLKLDPPLVASVDPITDCAKIGWLCVRPLSHDQVVLRL